MPKFARPHDTALSLRIGASNRPDTVSPKILSREHTHRDQTAWLGR
jgi:hypothetical protein